MNNKNFGESLFEKISNFPREIIHANVTIVLSVATTSYSIPLSLVLLDKRHHIYDTTALYLAVNPVLTFKRIHYLTVKCIAV